MSAFDSTVPELRNSDTNTVPTTRSPNNDISPLLNSTLPGNRAAANNSSTTNNNAATVAGNNNNNNNHPIHGRVASNTPQVVVPVQVPVATVLQQQYINTLMNASLSAQNYMNEIIGPHNRTTSIASLQSTSAHPFAGVHAHHPSSPGVAVVTGVAPGETSSGGGIQHHARTSSIIGAATMNNLFVNGNPSAVVHARSATNTLLSNSSGYIAKKERKGADEYIAALENIHKTYLLGIEGVPALRGVNVEIKRGEFMVVFGTSGGGKSTLLNILGTIDVPTKGNLMLLDSRITDRTPDADLARIRCRHIGFVFQSFNLLSTMTAIENVSLPMIIAGDLSRKQIKERAEMLLTMVGLAHRLDHYPSMLSGGEQQRVTIARSLANEPDLLLMDEPTGDLDTKNTHLILSILLNLNREKQLTMVMVTHDVYMKPYADRILYLRDGRVGNIEVVPPEVNEQAYENLLDLVEEDKLHVGEHVFQTDLLTGKNAASILRKSDDYETKNAIRPVDHSGMDADMRAAVEMLFGRNRSIKEEKVKKGRPSATDGIAA